LLAIVVSLTAPLITFSISLSPDHHVALPYISKEPVDFIIQQSPIPVNEECHNLFLSLSVIYLAGLAIGLLRFVKRVAYFLKAHNENP